MQKKGEGITSVTEIIARKLLYILIYVSSEGYGEQVENKHLDEYFLLVSEPLLWKYTCLSSINANRCMCTYWYSSNIRLEAAS